MSIFKIRLNFDIYALYFPFENPMVQFKMTPAEIRSLIFSGYERQQLLDFLVSGIQYIVKVTPGKKVKALVIRDEKGKLLEETKTYTVGMNDYITRAYQFTDRAPGQSLMGTVNEALIHYLKQEKDIPICQGIKCLRMMEIPAEEKTGNKDDLN